MKSDLKRLGLIILALALPLLVMSSGCARFTTTQQDITYVNGQPTRKITTRATAGTFYESQSALANFKASQTDKTQSATVGTLSQESGGTNTAATVQAVTELLKTIAK
jgi:hypothetical protein